MREIQDIEKNIENEIKQIINERHRILVSRNHHGRIVERKKEFDATREKLFELKAKYADADKTEGKPVFLKRDQILVFWKAEYGIESDEAEDILMEFEMAGADYNKSPIPKTSARLMLFFDFENYDMDRLRKYGYYRDTLIKGAMTSEFFNQMTDDEIQNIRSTHEKALSAKKKIDAACERSRAATDNARNEVSRSKTILETLEKMKQTFKQN